MTPVPFLAKIDARLSDAHYATFKYNYTWSEQENGTFDVDSWARSANAVEQDWSHAFNGSLLSLLSATTTNEFRFQVSREDRPRPYLGPDNPNTGRPFPDTGMDFVHGYRFGMPFFIPVEYYDTRIQALDNISVAKGDHLIKAGVEWNRVESVQTFIGFANGRYIFSSLDGFLNFVEQGNGYVECADGNTSTTGACPDGTDITGPVLLYLQQSGVGDLTVEEAGTQQYPTARIGPVRPGQLATLEQADAQLRPALGSANSAGCAHRSRRGILRRFHRQNSDQRDRHLRIPLQRHHPLGLGYVPAAPRSGLRCARRQQDLAARQRRDLLRPHSGLELGQHALDQWLARAIHFPLQRPDAHFRSTADLRRIATHAPRRSLSSPASLSSTRISKTPRTISANVGIERELHASGIVGSFGYTYARADNLTRFVNRNDAIFGSPWATGLGADGSNGIGDLTVVESTAKSRYHGLSFGLRQMVHDDLQFQLNYTLSWDKSDDDNERDPFTFRYVDPTQLEREWGYSDRDQRHRFNAWALAALPGGMLLNQRLSYYSAQPVSASCAGDRSTNPWGAASDRICDDGSITARNTLRKDNDFFSYDVRLSRPIPVGNGQLEAIVEVFNLLNTDNFRDPSSVGLLFNFDGTVQSGLGDPRQVQVGLRYVY